MLSLFQNKLFGTMGYSILFSFYNVLIENAPCEDNLVFQRLSSSRPIKLYGPGRGQILGRRLL